MKKTVTTLMAAMALMTATAQPRLTSRDVLPAPGGSEAATCQAPSPKHAMYPPLEGATYYMLSTSPEDERGNTVIGTGAATLWGNTVAVTLPADGASGEAVVRGMWDFGKNFTVSQLYDIKGTYDAEAKTLTIATPYDPTDVIGKGTRIADYNRYGVPFESVILACRIGDKPDLATGEYPINIYENLVFSVGDDMSLTPQTQWLIYSGGGDKQGIDKIFSSSVFYPLTEQATLKCWPQSVSFPLESTMAGVASTQHVLVANIGRTSCDCEYNVTGAEELGLQWAAYETISPISSVSCNVTSVS